MKRKDENAKNPNFQVPVNLPSVKPEDYDTSIDSAHGSAHRPGVQKRYRQLPTPGEAKEGAQ